MTTQPISCIGVLINSAVVFVAARYAVLVDVDFVGYTWGFDVEDRVIFAGELVDERYEDEYDYDDGGCGDGAETAVVATGRTLAFFFGDICEGGNGKGAEKESSGVKTL
ncbi:hypothetical protein BOTCAL_0071g00110 [Botryotinia calthae]|uniref:Uncharacterized protein n=1 Tax=Botryotinia calthae TaxID=38488 RepID=A0A4Y8D8V2_9HELO|nr:hypothetical protein BOTCAL_0071g00110 [Botryotinia calthae]